jgi:hypothetical protein
MAMAFAATVFTINFLGLVWGINERDKWLTGLGLVGSLCGLLLLAGELLPTPV